MSRRRWHTRTSGTASPRSTRASSGRSSTRATWSSSTGGRAFVDVGTKHLRAARCSPRSRRRACARGGRLRDPDPRPPRPRRRRRRDDAAAAAGAARRAPARRAPHGRPVEAVGGRDGRLRRGGDAPQLRRARAGRAGARRRGAGRASGSSSAAGRCCFLDTPGHARHHFCVWDEASRGMFTGDTFGALVPRAGERAGRLHPAHDDPGPVRAGGAQGRRSTAWPAHAPRPLYLTHYSRVTRGRAAGRRPAPSDRRARRRWRAPRTAGPTGPRGCGRRSASCSWAGRASTARRCRTGASPSCWPSTSS